jgi:hypothetical protein
VSDDPIPNIIEEVKWSVKRYTTPDEDGEGVDLLQYKDELRELLSVAHERYKFALEEWEARAGPNKPKEKLKENWDPDDFGPVYDYGDMAGADLDYVDKWGNRHNWDEHWQRFHSGLVGNQGGSRDGSKDAGVRPIPPLYPVYVLVRKWWLKYIGGGFNLKYHTNPELGDNIPRNSPKHMPYINPPARLFLLVAQDINFRYTVSNCAGVHDALRTKKKRASHDRLISP